MHTTDILATGARTVCVPALSICLVDYFLPSSLLLLVAFKCGGVCGAAVSISHAQPVLRRASSFAAAPCTEGCHGKWSTLCPASTHVLHRRGCSPRNMHVRVARVKYRYVSGATCALCCTKFVGALCSNAWTPSFVVGLCHESALWACASPTAHVVVYSGSAQQAACLALALVQLSACVKSLAHSYL